MGVRTRRPGIGLIELVAALAIGGLIILSARSVLEHITDAGKWLNTHAAVVEKRANAGHLVRTAVGNMESPTIVSPAVRGDAQTAVFETWCDVPGGWQERCQLTIRLVARAEGNALVATFGPETIVVRDGFATGALRYLVDPRHGGAWLDAWTSEITAPAAFAVIVDGDTLIVRIGERG